MARIYGVFTPGQMLCQRFQSIISLILTRSPGDGNNLLSPFYKGRN